MNDSGRVALAVQCLLIAVKKFYCSDNEIFKNFKKDIKGMERACAFRIGSYYREMIEDKETSSFYGYNVDMEYNRQEKCGITKKVNDNNIFPDLLMHRRGVKDNILICEFKAQDDMSEGDSEKLREMTQQGGCFSYSIGIFINLGKLIKNCEIIFFYNGFRISKKDFFGIYGINGEERTFMESLIRPMKVMNAIEEKK